MNSTKNEQSTVSSKKGLPDHLRTGVLDKEGRNRWPEKKKAYFSLDFSFTFILCSEELLRAVLLMMTYSSAIFMLAPNK